MRQLEEKGIIIDWCELCDGIWLDAGELAHLTETPGDLSAQSPERQITKTRRSAHPFCPHCRLLMEEFPYTDGENIFLDRCPKCLGIWLERGELQAVYDHWKQQSVGLSAAAPSQNPATLADPMGWIAIGIILLIIIGSALFFVLHR